MLAVVFVLAATLTLLPAVLGKLGAPGRRAGPALGARRRAPLAALRPWAERLWRRPVAYGAARAGPARGAGRCPCSDCAPACPRSRSCPRPTRPTSATGRAAGFRPRRPGMLQVVGPAGDAAGRGGPGDRPGHRRGPARAAVGGRAERPHPGDAGQRPVGEGAGDHRRPAADRAARGGPGRRRRRGEPRPGEGAGRRDPAGARGSSSGWASCCCSSPCRRRWPPPSAWSRTCWPSAPPSAWAG